jgi:hypothetical protein
MRSRWREPLDPEEVLFVARPELFYLVLDRIALLENLFRGSEMGELNRGGSLVHRALPSIQQSAS